MHSGTLFVVSTPIGNLGDLGERAREVLKRVDLIAAEDTRRTGQLLAVIGSSVRTISLHEHNEEKRIPEVIAGLRTGTCYALVSDAGTPLISDPGYRLLSAVREADLPVSPIPGPCAMVAALSVAGLPTDRFCFEGFLPTKGRGRRERLAQIASETRTTVIYEAPHRLLTLLEELEQQCGAERPVQVARELTKRHE